MHASLSPFPRIYEHGIFWTIRLGTDHFLGKGGVVFGNLQKGNFSALKTAENTYLLLTEFKGRTVSYGPSFFQFAYGLSAKRAGHKLTGKNEDP